KIGPFTLPVFIVLCMFAPFALSFICFFIYYYTIKRPHNRRQLADEPSQTTQIKKDVKVQVRSFV
ncbi:hypothetical protein BS50DRAFT_468071, partial [Corynespora cassiicola Philippines]